MSEREKKVDEQREREDKYKWARANFRKGHISIYL
jgi:hypothetical protein